MGRENSADDAGSMKTPALSQRTQTNIEELQAELAATRGQLERSLDTINNLSSTINFLRKHR